jgi:ribosomal protein L30/L7E
MKKQIIVLLLASACLSLTSFDYAPYYTPAATARLPIPTNAELVSGLKQALEQGTVKSADRLSSLNGFFGNAAIKILMPPEAQKAEKTLRKLGLNKLCDNVILSLNRAAEDAAKQAKPIFINAVKQMTVQDAANILTGSKDAATQYFKRTTTADLTTQFKPVIHTSLSNVGATNLYGQLATQYNKIPLTFTKVNPNLDEYVTQRAIDGLFYQIALEELNIRQNLSARTTPILQKVFGFLDQKK